MAEQVNVNDLATEFGISVIPIDAYHMRPELKEKASVNIEFQTDLEKNGLFAGFTDDEIITLTNRVVDILKIPARHIPNITVVYSDSMVIGWDGEQVGFHAFQQLWEDSFGFASFIGISRSRSVREGHRGNWKSQYELEEQKYRDKGILKKGHTYMDRISAISVEEYLVAILAEELHHAKYDFMKEDIPIKRAIEERRKIQYAGGNFEEVQVQELNLQQNFENILQKKGLVQSHLYEILLHEFAAGKVVLQTLAKYFEKSNPERSQYFSEQFYRALYGYSRPSVLPIPEVAEEYFI